MPYWSLIASRTNPNTRRIARRVLCSVLLGLSFGGCGADHFQNRPAPTSIASTQLAAPLFYRVSGGRGATVLLLGTLHLGPVGGWELSPAIVDGLGRMDRMVLEIDLREATEDAVSTLLANIVMIEPPETLADWLSPETQALLDSNEEVLIASGFPKNARKRMKPWFIAMGMLESATSRSGFSSSASTEATLMASLDGRPLVALETFTEQMMMLDGLSPTLQDLLLRDTILQHETATEGIGELVTAWRTGDEIRLAEIGRESTEELPDLEYFYEILFDDRNHKWLSPLRSFLDGPEYSGEIVFVGVGAGHLLYKEGLVNLFRNAGYRVEAIDHAQDIEVDAS
jgi:uncharacterized protein YbaP (TraB family)